MSLKERSIAEIKWIFVYNLGILKEVNLKTFTLIQILKVNGNIDVKIKFSDVTVKWGNMLLFSR